MSKMARKKSRRKLGRKLGNRRYRKIFIIATEGNKTEPEYFKIFNKPKTLIKIHCLKSKDRSAPQQVLNRMQEYLKKEGLLKSDEAWLVVDKDDWQNYQLDQLFQWSQQAKNYGFALSNPSFEYWLLLHFEDGNNVQTSRQCRDKLKHCLPNYSKTCKLHGLFDRVDGAISRAKTKDNPPCQKWPIFTGTTVYRLVENILKSQQT